MKIDSMHRVSRLHMGKRHVTGAIGHYLPELNIATHTMRDTQCTSAAQLKNEASFDPVLRGIGQCYPVRADR